MFALQNQHHVVLHKLDVQIETQEESLDLILQGEQQSQIIQEERQDRITQEE